jgi:hypothetical protein
MRATCYLRLQSALVSLISFQPQVGETYLAPSTVHLSTRQPLASDVDASIPLVGY